MLLDITARMACFECLPQPRLPCLGAVYEETYDKSLAEALTRSPKAKLVTALQERTASAAAVARATSV